MPLIRPFTGLRPLPDRAADLAAPPYDVLSNNEARERAAGHSWSFLHVSKPEINLPEDVNPYDPEVYVKGAENFRRLLDEGLLIRDQQPCYYLYRLVMGTHCQTGIAAAASVEAYDRNRIRRHEFTRPDKEEDRFRHIDTLNAQTGPVLLCYRPSQGIDSLVTELCRLPANMDITLDGVRHTLWVISAEQDIERITELFERVGNLYIADGHHRSAAASRVASLRQASNPDHTGDESYNFFLAVIFPSNQLQILDYNRVITDLNGLSPQSFLRSVSQSFRIEPCTEAIKPARAGEFGMYLRDQWYRLRIHVERIPESDPVARLDASLLSTYILGPILGIHDLRRDGRIDFVGGIRGLAELEKRVDSGEMAVAFSLFPTRIEDVMAVADAGEIMPPKSTWFEPKLADGLISRILD